MMGRVEISTSVLSIKSQGLGRSRDAPKFTEAKLDQLGLAYELLIHNLFTISKDASRQLLMMDTPISF